MIIDIIVIVIILVMIFAALRYLFKENKKNNHCIGCSYIGTCHKCKNETNKS